MTIGFVCGAFDLLHLGHIHLLREASRNCDKLVVGLHVNPQIERREKNIPIEGVFERYIKLKSLKYVDSVIPYETEYDLKNLLKYIKPDIRFLGSDYKDTENKTITAEDEADIIYIDSLPIHTSDIRKRVI